MRLKDVVLLLRQINSTLSVFRIVINQQIIKFDLEIYFKSLKGFKIHDMTKAQN